MNKSLNWPDVVAVAPFLLPMQTTFIEMWQRCAAFLFSLIYSFIHSFVRSFVRPFIHFIHFLKFRCPISAGIGFNSAAQRCQVVSISRFPSWGLIEQKNVQLHIPSAQLIWLKTRFHVVVRPAASPSDVAIKCSQITNRNCHGNPVQNWMKFPLNDINWRWFHWRLA